MMKKKFRKVLARIIGLKGFVVYEAVYCKIALKKLEQRQPAIVLCDVKLPDCTGVDPVKEIKEKYILIIKCHCSCCIQILQGIK